MKFPPGVAGYLAPRVLKALAATWRFQEADESGPTPPRRRLDPVVYSLWHGELLAPMMRFAPLGLTTMISRHSDGDIAASIIRSLGARAVRGSSSSGGGGAAREMIELGRQGSPLAITPDGPRGPQHRCKPGVLWVASQSRLPIVPMGSWPEASWRASSWDRFVVPRPGTTVHVVFHRPISIPPEVATTDVPGWLEKIDAAIEAASAQARRLAGGGGP